MPKCKYCNIDRPDSSFQIAKKIDGKIYRRLKCSYCKIQQQEVRKKDIYAWLLEIKKKLKCTKCGFSNPYALQFHHENPTEKEDSISQGINNGWSKQHLLIEISKCVCLCANCHQILHTSGK